MQFDDIRRCGVCRAGLVVILAGLAGACVEQTQPAPVFLRGGAEPSIVPLAVPPPTGLQVIVMRGQTLDGYAYTYHLPKSALIAANGLRPPYAIHEGQPLIIPDLAAQAHPMPGPMPMAPRVAQALPPPRPAPQQQAAIPQPPPSPQTIAPPRPATTAAQPPQTIFPAQPQAASAPAPQPAFPRPQPAAPAQLTPQQQAAATPQTLTPPPSAAKVLPEIIPLDGPPAKDAAAPAAAQAQAPAAVPLDAAQVNAQANGAPSVLPPRNLAAALPLPGEQPAPATAAPPAAQASVGGRFPWPVRGHVLASYGNSPGGGHNDGINIAAPRGTPVRAIEGGTVAYAGNEVKGYGNIVLIRHPDGWISAYAHLDDVTVKVGETIGAGQVFGKVGDSGGVGEPQLHFELRRGKKAVDPTEFLAPAPSAAAPAGDRAG